MWRAIGRALGVFDDMCRAVWVVARDVSLLFMVNMTFKHITKLLFIHPVRPVGAPDSRNRVLATFASR